MTDNVKNRMSLLPYNGRMLISEIILLLFEAVFIGLLLVVNLLPIKFLAPIIGFIVVADLLIFWLVGSRSGINRRIIGMILAVLMACVMSLGSWYLYSTYSAFGQILNFGGQYELYDVVVTDESSRETVEDIAGEEVYVTSTQLKSYEEAQGKLANTVSIEYSEDSDIITTGERLCDANGVKNDDAVIFISHSNYDILCDEIDGYKKSTKIIEQIKVETKTNDSTSDVNVTEDSFNIYISGIDVWGEIEQVSRSDVNMLVTVNPKTRQILLTSIPRDAYVTLHSYGQPDKLTHSGVYGIDETLLTIEDWLGVKSDFYVRANFNMVVELVNALHGIKVWSDYDFDSSISDYSYKKGWNRLSGGPALYFARERKCFEDNDQQRILNQQAVVKAIVKKMSTKDEVLANYTQILDAVSGYMQTNMPKKDISALVKMQLNDMETGWTVNSIAIRGTMDSKGTYSMGLGRPLDVCIMDEDSVDKAIKTINEVMYPVDDMPVTIQDDKSSGGVKN